MEQRNGLEGIWNLPNRITLGRLVLSMLLFVVLGLMQGGVVSHHGAFGWVAFVLFVVAAGTDWLDGHLARKHGLVTVFGRIMDPFVDKVVVCGVFIFLCADDGVRVWMPAWMVVVIMGREFFVSAVRGFMESQGVNFQADMPGKVKMAIQCVAIGAILFLRCLVDASGDLLVDGLGWAVDVLELATPILVWLTLLSTIHSGWYYGRKAALELKELRV